jgi:hypothetical protein
MEHRITELQGKGEWLEANADAAMMCDALRTERDALASRVCDLETRLTMTQDVVAAMLSQQPRVHCNPVASVLEWRVGDVLHWLSKSPQPESAPLMQELMAVQVKVEKVVRKGSSLF